MTDTTLRRRQYTGHQPLSQSPLRRRERGFVEMTDGRTIFEDLGSSFLVRSNIATTPTFRSEHRRLEYHLREHNPDPRLITSMTS